MTLTSGPITVEIREGMVVEERHVYEAEDLGQMSDDELREIRRCELCLESYERCQCKLGRLRQREESNTDSSPDEAT